MNKKKRRYKGLILSCVSVMMLVVSIFSFSFVSSASDRVYYMPINEPAMTDSQGYVLLEMKNDNTGEYICRCVFWDIVGFDENGDLFGDISTYMNILVESDSLTLQPISTPDGSTLYCFYSIVYDDIGYVTPSSFVSNANSSYSPMCNIPFAGYSVVGVSFYGNVNTMDLDFGMEYKSINVVWADEKTLVDEVVNVKNQIISLDSTCVEECYKIISKLGYTNECLDELIVLQNLMLDKQDETNSWLEKIWNSIQEFFTSKGDDKEVLDKFEEENKEQSDKLNDLNEQNKTDKVDVDSAINSVEGNVDFDSIGTFSNIFVYITENEYVLQMLLLVFSVALVSYVLFGKK